jgi:hypothetical protein
MMRGRNDGFGVFNRRTNRVHPEMKDSGWSREPSAFRHQQKHFNSVQLAEC